jgi:hypothetical protein
MITAGLGLDGRVSVVEVARRLPDISRTRDLSQAIAMLDAILVPDWSSRSYAFNAEWAPGEAMASRRSGAGDEYSIVFSAAGACARGFDHESPLSPYRNRPPTPGPGLLDQVPAAFRSVMTEPAFSAADGTLLATALLWRETADPAWSYGDIESDADDGADWLFEILTDPTPEAFHEFAQQAYDLDVDLNAIRHVYRLRPLTRAVVTALNRELDLDDLEPDRKQIGYPAPAAEELPEKPRRSRWGWPLLQ